MTTDKAASLAQHLVDITCNLGQYVEDQARGIAGPRITAVERQMQERINHLRDDLAAETRRREDLVGEFRRQIGAMERQLDRANRQLKATREYADKMATVGLEREADELRETLNRSRHHGGHEPDKRVAAEYAKDTRVWSVMARHDDMYEPVGAEGARDHVLGCDMYDWARDAPGEVALGYQDRTGWYIEEGSER